MSDLKTDQIADQITDSSANSGTGESKWTPRRRGESRVRDMRWHRTSSTDAFPAEPESFTVSELPSQSSSAPTARHAVASEESMRSGGVNELMAPQNNVQRIMSTGTAWFAVAVGSTALAIAPLVSSGWRPAGLPEPIQILWWVGALVVTLSIGLIGWSGCPILEVDVPTADRNKTRTMQVGTMLFILGGAASLLAVLLGPVQ
ncbi:hypothetical protein [Naasia lichenicola]|uniref:Uncharacterized protein n=1 Tax=Naasia lichenicola TaxID=2565933 RepID=A0A4S4FT89_9MICO|nr:hypothetical protein [Naasia lichenicola]THG33541.1 hypothetical protein E6C64_04180 [Naasia lichenicola]